jgi:hypothetical protein
VSLREAVEADRTGAGGVCPVAVLVKGGVPSGSEADVGPLEADDREFLAESCAPGSPAVLAKIRRRLVGIGYKVGETALQAHRRGDCACP